MRDGTGRVDGTGDIEGSTRGPRGPKKIAVAIFRQQEESIANTMLISRLRLGAAATGGVVSRATCTATFCKYHFVVWHLLIFGDYN